MMRHGRDDDLSPESPPSYEATQGRGFYTSPTKIRIETDEESFQYSLDRSGHETGYTRPDNRDDFENVGGLSISSSSSVRRDGRHETGRDTRGGFWSHEDRPTARGITMSHDSHASRQSTQENLYRGRRNSDGSKDDGRPLYDLESGISGIGMPFRTTSGSGDNRGRELITPPPPKPKNSCWNCKGDHMITECTVPKDPRRIAMNRKAFLASKPQRTDFSGGGRPKRYHEEQPRNNTRPGILSDDIRYAMDLELDEVPIHVYRMRIFGYPPGWLENAMEEATGGLKLYGDSIITTSRKDPKIDPDNIIRYPGYNAPMPYGQSDRGKDYNCPRYRPEDSIDNMIRKLNSKNLVSQGDGIVSQSMQPPQFDSLTGLDRPMLNDGASHGVGRGRVIEVDTLPRHLQPGGLGMPNARPLFQGRIDREIRPMSRPSQPIVEQEIDKRYLPKPSRSTSQKRSRRHTRTPSPSLLRDADMLHCMLPKPAGNAGRSDNRVIMNLPPISGSQRSTVTGNSDEESTGGSSAGSTGSSNDFVPSSPVAKRKKDSQKSESDDDVMIISTKTGLNPTVDSDSDCLVIDDDTVSRNPTKPTSSRASPQKVKNVTLNRSSVFEGRRSVIQARSSALALGSSRVIAEDWENDDDENDNDNNSSSKFVTTSNKRPTSPGSSTGDEETFLVNFDFEKGTPIRKSRGTFQKGFDEDWETGSANSDRLVIDEEDVEEVMKVNDTQSNVGAIEDLEPEVTVLTEKTISPVREFIPSNPKNEAIKEVLLAQLGEGDRTDENAESFTSLPAFEKFAQGMPEMVFEDEAPVRNGRLERVLQVLKTRKSAGNNIISPDRSQQ